MSILIDTGFVVAAASLRDTNHISARQAMRALVDVRIVPAPVIQETFYILTNRVSYHAAVAMLKTLRTGAFQIESLTDSDMARMEEIMAQYEDNKFDYADTAIMALAERLNITEVYTFDRRDFSVFIPLHCDYLELLP